MKKMLFALMIFAFIILGLIFAPTIGVQAQSTYEISLAHPKDTYTVSTDDYIVLRLGWVDCTSDLVYRYIDSVIHTLMLDSDILVSYVDIPHPGWHNTWNDYKDYFTDVVPFSDSIGIDCWWPPTNENMHFVDWRYPLGTLTPGTYKIKFSSRFNDQVPDAFDMDGDGKWDYSIGMNLKTKKTIIVE